MRKTSINEASIVRISRGGFIKTKIFDSTGLIESKALNTGEIIFVKRAFKNFVNEVGNESKESL